MGWWKSCDKELPKKSGYYRVLIYYKDVYSKNNLTLKSVTMYYDSRNKDFKVCNNCLPFRYTDIRIDYEVIEVISWRYNVLKNIIDIVYKNFKERFNAFYLERN